MKITRSQLKQIIKEELLKEVSEEEQVAIDHLERIMTDIHKTYGRLPTDRLKEDFEGFLKKNIDMTILQWQETRNPSPIDTDDLEMELD